MRAPAFWWRGAPSPLARALRPAGWLYGAVAAGRLAKAGARAGIPVICIGNFTVGGAGKTPLALAVAERLAAAGERPAFLSRGYGGRELGPLLVDPARHRASDVGDEPLLLARRAPTVVARDRAAGAQAAVAAGASVIVMDDGLQNPSLAKDLALAVVDGATGLGNGLVLPAGPLRAPIEAQWPRVQAVVVVGPGAAGIEVAAEAARRGVPAFRATLVPEAGADARWSGRRVLAFAGIGRPDKFFETLEGLGAVVVRRRPFPDHHAYRPAEIAALRAEAAEAGLDLATTEKDRVRLRDALPEAMALPVTASLDDPGGLDALIGRVLAGRAP